MEKMILIVLAFFISIPSLYFHFYIWKEILIIMIRFLAKHKGIKFLETNTKKNHLPLTRITFVIIMGIIVLASTFLWTNIRNDIPSLFGRICWIITQFTYLYSGLANCFGYRHKRCKYKKCKCKCKPKPKCKCESKLKCKCGCKPNLKHDPDYYYTYAHAHNIFLLTILYIISTFCIFFLFMHGYTLIKRDHCNNTIGNIISLIGIIATFSALSLAGKVSSVNSMIIVLSIFLLTQCGFLFWIY